MLSWGFVNVRVFVCGGLFITVSYLSPSLVTMGKEEEGCLEGVSNKELLLCKASMPCFVVINNNTNDKVLLCMFRLSMLFCPSTIS